MRTGESVTQLRPVARRAGASKLRAAARRFPSSHFTEHLV